MIHPRFLLRRGGESLSAGELSPPPPRPSRHSGAAEASPGLRPLLREIAAAAPGEQFAAARAVCEARAAGEIPLLRSSVAAAPALALPAGTRLPPGLAWAASTSGSTGRARILLRTERSWSDSFPAVSALLDAREGERMLLTAPLTSSLSLFSLAHAAATGLELLLPAGTEPSAEDLARADLVHTTPYGLLRIVERLEGARAGSGPRAALVGGAALDPGVRARAAALGLRVVTYYGAAELSFVAADADGRGLRAFPGVRVRLRGGNLEAATPFAAAGMLLEGGPEGWRFEPLAARGGWFGVGDRARLGADGAIELRGRADGAILSAAATVIPEDVEAALRGIPGVRDAVVFARDAPRIGSQVCAVVEPAGPEAGLSAAALRRALAPVLAPAQTPRRWYVLPELPRGASGKPRRAEIAAAARAEGIPRLD